MNSNPAIYEINTRVWIKRFGVKSLNEIPSGYWRELKSKGIDFIWLMGVWKTCDAIIEKYCFEEDLVKSYERALKDYSKEDVIGSPFAIDQYEVREDLGGNTALQRLRAKLKDAGLGLILDFIPNHFSAGSSLIQTNPEIFLKVNRDFFEKDSHTYFKAGNNSNYFAHGRDPFYPAWQDTVQVNYFYDHSRNFMTDILLKLTGMCDGVRCDMAMLMINNVFKNTWTGVVSCFGMHVPETEFWRDAIGNIKSKRSDFLFIAEAYWDLEWELQQQGFDFTYDKRLTDRLRFGNVNSIHEHLKADQKFQKKLVRFIENHDEARAIVALGRDREKAAAVIISTVQGAKLYHDGQFEGKKIKLPVQLGREPFEHVAEDLKVCYDKILSVTQREIFKKGEWTLLKTESSWERNNTNNNILTWLLESDNERILVAVNYSDIISTCRIKLELQGYPDEFELKDLLSNQIYIRSTEELYLIGLYIELKPWHSHIFSF